MDLTLTEEQELLRATVRDMCAKHSTPEIVRAMENDPVGYRPELWRELADTGLLGLIVPEAFGGAGLTAIEVALAYEELGRALCWTPHFTTAVLGASLIQRGGTEAQQQAWLPAVASGEAVLTTAWLEPEGGSGSAGIQMSAEQNGDGYRLSGTKILVPFAASATRLITLARTGPSDVDVFLVDPKAPGLSIDPVDAMAGDPESLIRFDGVEVAAADRLPGGWAAWEEAATDGLIALGAYAAGGATRAHELAVEYAKEREQFGRPIGSFQGLAHPLAEMAMEVGGARTLVHEAAWTRSMGRSAATLAAMAKLYAADVFRRATKLGHQVFGGIGFTLDIDMQLYFRRAKQLELSWWEPRYLEERVAAAELDAENPFVGVDAGT